MVVGGSAGAAVSVTGAGSRPAAAATAAADDDTLVVTPRTATADINAWLARRDPSTGTRRLVGAAVLTAPLVVLSGTRLDASGASITGPATTNILRNAAAVPAATATVSVVAGSGSVVARSAVFTAAMVGRRVQVLGAGPRAGRIGAPGSMYGTITAVSSGTTATLDVLATTSMSAATALLFPPNDSAVSITGGTWTNRNKNTLSQTTESHGLLIRRASDVTLSGLTLLSTGSRQVGGQYAISLGDVTDVTATDLAFVDTASDGIHFQGPAARLTVQRITGDRTGDDLVAFTTVDGQSRDGSLLGDCEGDIADVVVEDVQGNDCHTHLKVTSGTGAAGKQRRLQRFSAKGISGTATGGSPVNVVDYAGPTWFAGSIAQVTATAGANPMVNIAARTLGAVTVEDVTWPASSPAPAAGIVRFSGKTAGTITVNRLTNRSVAGSTADTTGSGVLLAYETVSTIAVSGVSCPVLASHFDSLQLGMPGVKISSLSISDDTSAARTGNVFAIPASAARYTIKAATFDRIERTTGSAWAAESDGTRTTTAITVQEMDGGRAVALMRTPALLTIRTLTQPGASGAAVRLNSTNASPFRIVVDDDSARPQPLLSRTATQAVSVTGAAIGVDAGLLTPMDGDVVRNTGTRFPSGVIRWDAASKQWRPTSGATANAVPGSPPTSAATPAPSAVPTPAATPVPSAVPTPAAPAAPAPSAAPTAPATPEPTATALPTG